LQTTKKSFSAKALPISGLDEGTEEKCGKGKERKHETRKQLKKGQFHCEGVNAKAGARKITVLGPLMGGKGNHCEGRKVGGIRRGKKDHVSLSDGQQARMVKQQKFL